MENEAKNTFPKLSLKNITKSFQTNMVLKGIDLEVMPGEVLALIGGNGAGKSTLMKIIMSIYKQDKGQIFVEGIEKKSKKTSDSLDMGIYMVPQEPRLFPHMSVEENILIGLKGNKQDLKKQIKRTLTQMDWTVDLNRKADTLSIAEQQLVEISKGLVRESKILILDEPTSSLTFDDVRSLFEIIEILKKKKISIIYITHRLNEVFEIATCVAIMRDGTIALQGPIEEFNQEMLVKGLLPDGKKLKVIIRNSQQIDYQNLTPILEVENYSGYGFKNISFRLFPGEILGLGGVVGAGRTEIATTIFHKDRSLGGKVLLVGKDISEMKTRDIIKNGLMYVSEDRFLNGIYKISSIKDNVTAASLDGYGKTVLKNKEELKTTKKYITQFGIKTTDEYQEIGSLSGGNQQKVILSRALCTEPKVIILDEPTRGIDAGARGDVYEIIHELKKKGVAILLISSDMEEIVQLSDRALIMYGGKINEEFSKEQISEEVLMAASFGLKREEQILWEL